MSVPRVAPASLAVTLTLLCLFAASGADTARAGARPDGRVPAATSATFVRALGNVVGSRPVDVTPQDVIATADGGYLAMGTTVASSRTRAGVAWLVKLSAAGRPQWQRQVGCLTGAPGNYADALSVTQLADGSYLAAGGTIGCGSTTCCGNLSGRSCGLVEKISGTGALVWARTYDTGGAGTTIMKITPTHGGALAIGQLSYVDGTTGGLVLKLNGGGAVQWRQALVTGTATVPLLNAVAPTADGGYVIVGDLDSPSGAGPIGIFAAKLDADGTLRWQRNYNRYDAGGTALAHTDASSVLATADGGYLIGGRWGPLASPGCCNGALLLKLDARGNLAWQRVYRGQNYCYFNGFNTTCVTLGAGVYALSHAVDGGYLLAGDQNLKLTDSVPLVPWLAKVDATGTLLWQRAYSQTHPSTGRPISQYFQASLATADGGTFSLGFSENASTLTGQLYAVRTDDRGLVSAGACSDLQAGPPLTSLDPALTATPIALQSGTPPVTSGSSPATSSPTPIATQTEC